MLCTNQQLVDLIYLETISLPVDLCIRNNIISIAEAST